jgi:hypothetical protein
MVPPPPKYNIMYPVDSQVRPVINYLCTYDLYSPVHNVYDACISITRGSGRGWALEFSSFLGPVKWHRADRRVPFGGGLGPIPWGVEEQVNKGT